MTTPPPYGSTPGEPQESSSGSSPAGSTGGSSAGWTPPAGGDQQGYGQPQYGQPQYSQPESGQPQYGQPQYGQPQYGQPQYGQSQYGQQGYPPPGYPPAPGYPSAGYPSAGYPSAGYPGGMAGGVKAGRPGMVTAAAVLAFVWAAFAIIVGLVVLAATSVLSAAGTSCTGGFADSDTARACTAVATYSGFFKVLTAGLMIIAILLIWGGVVALTGKNGQILVIGAAVYVLLDIISIFVSISNDNFGSSGVLGIAAPVLMLVFMLNPRSKAWFRSKGAKTF